MNDARVARDTYIKELDDEVEKTITKLDLKNTIK